MPERFARVRGETVTPLIPGEHSPDDTSILVGERHGRDVRMPTLAKASKPTASRILLAPSFAKSCASAVDHQRA
jgi:hypothetical protein